VKVPRRQFLHLAAAGVAALSTVSRITWAQAYPSRPVRLIVGYAAGSPLDTSARLIAQWLSERLSQPFIIKNRPARAATSRPKPWCEPSSALPPKRTSLSAAGMSAKCQTRTSMAASALRGHKQQSRRRVVCQRLCLATNRGWDTFTSPLMRARKKTPSPTEGWYREFGRAQAAPDSSAPNVVFELHYSDAIWVIRAIRVDHTNPCALIVALRPSLRPPSPKR
jgi:hypothetical protein